jgi:putative transposase
MPLRRPKRLEGFSYRGPHRYLLTFRIENRQPLFVEADLVGCAVRQFDRTAGEEQFAILADCLMPDHAHLVVEGLSEDSDLRRFEGMAKQDSAYALWKNDRRQDVWQEGFHDWVIRPDQSIMDVIFYVLNNPVRAGLVDRWDKYPFSRTLYPLV